jgi:hypothetical protein
VLPLAGIVPFDGLIRIQFCPEGLGSTDEAKLKFSTWLPLVASVSVCSDWLFAPPF